MHESLDEFEFRPDTTTNSRVICPCASEELMYNVVNTLAPSFLIGSSSFLQLTRTTINGRVQNSTRSDHGLWSMTVVSCSWASGKIPIDFYNGRNLVNTLAPSFLIGSSSFLQVTRTCMKAWMGSNFGKIPPQIGCPWASEKSMYNVLYTQAPSILIESSSFLHVTRTTIKSGLTSKLSLNALQSKLPLSAWKILHRLTMGETLLTL